MYESYWRLRQKPFENGADRRFYYPSEPHQAALLKLRYAIENRRGTALLTGPSGSGKTLIVEMLRQMLGDEYSPIVHLVFPQMTPAELLAYLAEELAGPDGDGGVPPVSRSVRRMERFLAANTEQGMHAVLAVDEAHLLNEARTLEALRLLSNFESGGRPGLTLLLAGQVGLLPVLERTPAFEERLGVKCLIRPLTLEETAAYVRHRLEVAGATQPIFSDDAPAALYRLTQGNVRRINRLCDLALLIGYAEERATLDADHLDAVSQELLQVVPE